MLNGTVTPAASAGLSGDGAPTLGGGGAVTTQPDSLAGAEVTPSETVTVQSGGAEKKLPSSLNAPFPSAVVERAPGVPVTIRLATAPLPSIRTLVPCNSARLVEIAAWAGPAATSTPSATTTPARHRGVRNFRSDPKSGTGGSGLNFIELDHFAHAETSSQRGIRGAARSGSRLLVRTLRVKSSATSSDSSYAARPSPSARYAA